MDMRKHLARIDTALAFGEITDRNRAYVDLVRGTIQEELQAAYDAGRQSAFGEVTAHMVAQHKPRTCGLAGWLHPNDCTCPVPHNRSIRAVDAEQSTDGFI